MRKKEEKATSWIIIWKMYSAIYFIALLFTPDLFAQKNSANPNFEPDLIYSQHLLPHLTKSVSKYNGAILVENLHRELDSLNDPFLRLTIRDTIQGIIYNSEKRLEERISANFIIMYMTALLAEKYANGDYKEEFVEALFDYFGLWYLRINYEDYELNVFKNKYSLRQDLSEFKKLVSIYHTDKRGEEIYGESIRKVNQIYESAEKRMNSQESFRVLINELNVFYEELNHFMNEDFESIFDVFDYGEAIDSLNRIVEIQASINKKCEDLKSAKLLPSIPVIIKNGDLQSFVQKKDAISKNISSLGRYIINANNRKIEIQRRIKNIRYKLDEYSGLKYLADLKDFFQKLNVSLFLKNGKESLKQLTELKSDLGKNIELNKYSVEFINAGYDFKGLLTDLESLVAILTKFNDDQDTLLRYYNSFIRHQSDFKKRHGKLINTLQNYLEMKENFDYLSLKSEVKKSRTSFLYPLQMYTVPIIHIPEFFINLWEKINIEMRYLAYQLSFYRITLSLNKPPELNKYGLESSSQLFKLSSVIGYKTDDAESMLFKHLPFSLVSQDKIKDKSGMKNEVTSYIDFKNEFESLYECGNTDANCSDYEKWSLRENASTFSGRRIRQTGVISGILAHRCPDCKLNKYFEILLEAPTFSKNTRENIDQIDIASWSVMANKKIESYYGISLPGFYWGVGMMYTTEMCQFEGEGSECAKSVKYLISKIGYKHNYEILGVDYQNYFFGFAASMSEIVAPLPIKDFIYDSPSVGFEFGKRVAPATEINLGIQIIVRPEDSKWKNVGFLNLSIAIWDMLQMAEIVPPALRDI